VIGHFTIGGRAVRADLARGVCVAIPLDFAGPQPCHFGVTAATAEALVAAGFVGDTRQGGSCNVPVITLNPHCNGTHTESISHIVDEVVPVHQVIGPEPIPATLITIRPVAAVQSVETYRPATGSDDVLITAESLTTALREEAPEWLEAVVVRTAPNDPGKQTRQYAQGPPPPYFTIEAMDYLRSRGTRHVLVDLPSVDRMHDEGLLTVHHRFWQVPEGQHRLTPESRLDQTITEMIFVPDDVADGRYLLSLQVPAFTTDVAPSRPWLFPVEFVA
jgi:kynurenine formamidase